MVRLLNVRGEATIQKNIEEFYASSLSWGMEEDYYIQFPDWEGVGEYRDPIDTNLILYGFLGVLPEVESLLN